MPSIVGQPTKRLGNGQSTSYGSLPRGLTDFLGATQPAFRDRNYPAVGGYEQYVYDYISDNSGRAAQGSGQPRYTPPRNRGGSVPPSGPRGPISGGPTSRPRSPWGDSRTRANTRTSTQGLRPFDLPTNNLPVPYGKLGLRGLRAFGLLATRDPRLNAIARAVDLATNLLPLINGEVDPSRGVGVTGSVFDPKNIPYYLAHSMGQSPPGTCQNCGPTASRIKHYFQERTLGPACRNNQNWGCGSAPAGPSCTIWELYTNSICNGCNRHVWRLAGCYQGVYSAGNKPPFRSPVGNAVINPQQAYQGFDMMPGAVTMWAPRPLPAGLLPYRINSLGYRASNGVRRARVFRVNEVPASQVEITLTGPGGGQKPPTVGRPNRFADPHVRRPPNSREREVKRRVGGALGQLIRKAISGVTESLDVINAIYDALPDYWRYECYAGKRSNQQNRTRIVFDWMARGLFGTDAAVRREAEDIIGQVLLNIAANELEDRLIGLGARARQDAYIAMGRDAGLPDPVKWATKRLVRDEGGVAC